VPLKGYQKYPTERMDEENLEVDSSLWSRVSRSERGDLDDGNRLPVSNSLFP